MYGVIKKFFLVSVSFLFLSESDILDFRGLLTEMFFNLRFIISKISFKGYPLFSNKLMTNFKFFS